MPIGVVTGTAWCGQPTSAAEANAGEQKTMVIANMLDHKDDTNDSSAYFRNGAAALECNENTL